MKLIKSKKQIKKLYKYARACGFSNRMFLTTKNLNRFIETVVDGFEGYPMFHYIFNGKFNAELFRRQMTIDLVTKHGTVAGLTSSEGYESVVIVTPPLVPEVGIFEYLRAVHLKDFPIFFKSATQRQIKYEKYAYKKREAFLDDKTWYIYIFATKNEFKRQGYGKRIMKVIKDFADMNGYRLILETDSDDNVAMYEKFGFTLMDTDSFKGKFNHFVMVYEN